jgi:hypothetical protein
MWRQLTACAIATSMLICHGTSAQQFARHMPDPIDQTVLQDIRTTLTLSDAQFEAMQKRFDIYLNQWKAVRKSEVEALANREASEARLDTERDQLNAMRIGFRGARSAWNSLHEVDIAFFEDCADMMVDAQMELLPAWQHQKHDQWDGLSLSGDYSAINLLQLLPTELAARHEAVRLTIGVAAERAARLTRARDDVCRTLDDAISQAQRGDMEPKILGRTIRQLLLDERDTLVQLDEELQLRLFEVLADAAPVSARCVAIRSRLFDSQVQDDPVRRWMLQMLARVHAASIPENIRIAADAAIMKHLQRLNDLSDTLSLAANRRDDIDNIDNIDDIINQMSKMQGDLLRTLTNIVPDEHRHVLSPQSKNAAIARHFFQPDQTSQSQGLGPIPADQWERILDLLTSHTRCDRRAMQAANTDLAEMYTGDVNAADAVDRQLIERVIEMECDDSVPLLSMELALDAAMIQRRQWAIERPREMSWIGLRAIVDPIAIGSMAKIDVTDSDIAQAVHEACEAIIRALDAFVTTINSIKSAQTDPDAASDAEMRRVRQRVFDAYASASEHIAQMLTDNQTQRWRAAEMRLAWPQITGPLERSRRAMHAQLRDGEQTAETRQSIRDTFAVLMSDVIEIEDKMLELVTACRVADNVLVMDPEVEIQLESLREQLHQRLDLLNAQLRDS